MSATDLIPILKQHRQFAILSSIGLALLYTEEAWANYNLWAQRPLNEALVLVVIISLVALGGFLFSFLFPPTLVTATWDHPRPWGVFINVAAWSVGITVVVNVVLYILLLYLVQFDFTASYNLLRDVYVYTLFATIFFHGFLMYIRYMHYLYSMPDFVQPIKVVAVSLGMAIVMLVVAAFLFLLDLYHFEHAPIHLQPILGLHIYARALYALTLALAVYVWHLRWIGDH